MENLHHKQNKVNILLKWGIVFSILWLAGIGSLIAFVSAMKAKKMINDSNDELNGAGRVWWCLIVGGFGILFWVPIVLIGIVNQL